MLSQLTVTSGFTAQDYVQSLVGPGIIVSNVTMTNNSGAQIGFFDGQNSNIGFNSGVLIGSEGIPSIGSLGIKKLVEAPKFKLNTTSKVGSDVLSIWVREQNDILPRNIVKANF